MKITDIKVHHLRVSGVDVSAFDGSYDTCIVQVETDEGLTGLGETDSLAPAIRGLIEGPGYCSRARSLKEILDGRDPSDPRLLWREMMSGTSYIGRRGLVMHAIGAVDIALWDLAGKIQDRPAGGLLGSVRHRHLPAYTTIYPMGRNLEEVRQQVNEVRSTHFRALKIAADPWWFEDVGTTERLLLEIRNTAGPAMKIMIDMALATDRVEQVLMLTDVFRKIGIEFLEAPLPLDDTEGHARLHDLGFAVGGGDLGLTHADEFVTLMERGKIDICQPDLSMAGGISGGETIREEALARGRRLIPHGYKTNILLAANLQFLSCHPVPEWVEVPLTRSPLRTGTTRESFPVNDDGMIPVPERPGLGITLDPAAVSRWNFPPGAATPTPPPS